MHLHGQTGSKKGRILHAAVIRCMDKDYCKSKKEIDDYLNAENLAMLSNQVRFDSSKYGEEAIISESILTWHKLPLKAYGRTLPYNVSLTKLLL